MTISTKVWDRARIKLETPGPAISLATDCATGPSVYVCNYVIMPMNALINNVGKIDNIFINFCPGENINSTHVNLCFVFFQPFQGFSKRVCNKKNFFLTFNQILCCGYSKEPSQ